MGAIAGAVGAGMAIGGTSMLANSAGQTKRALRRIAETPGLDLGAQYTEAESLMPRAQQLESKRNQFNVAELNKMLETSIPGYATAQGLRTNNAMAKLRGEIPLDVQQQLARSSAARSLEGGYGGSGMARNLTARDLGLTSLNLTGQGAQEFAGILGSTPMARQADFVMTPEEIAAMRAQERAMKMQASFAAEQQPGKSAVWGKQLQTVGDTVGMGGLNAGMGKMG